MSSGTRLNRLQRLMHLAVVAENQVGKELGLAKTQVEAENHKLKQLTGYQAEYRSELKSLENASTRGQVVQGYVQFLAQLDQAIRQQKMAVHRAERAVQERLIAWRHKRVRVKSMESLCASEKKDLIASTEKRRGNELDDRVTRTPPNAS